MGQTYNHEKQIFTMKIENGVGIGKTVNFKLAKETYNQIRLEQKNPNIFLSKEIQFLVTELKGDLKHPHSFEFIDNTFGDIKYVDGSMDISFYYIASNGYGNEIKNRFTTEDYCDHLIKVVKSIESRDRAKQEVQRLLMIKDMTPEEKNRYNYSIAINEASKIRSITYELELKAKQQRER
jgi:hypothetical protein